MSVTVTFTHNFIEDSENSFHYYAQQQSGTFSHDFTQTITGEYHLSGGSYYYKINSNIGRFTSGSSKKLAFWIYQNDDDVFVLQYSKVSGSSGTFYFADTDGCAFETYRNSDDSYYSCLYTAPTNLTINSGRYNFEDPTYINIDIPFAPIFDTEAHANAYLAAISPDFEGCLNLYEAPAEPEGSEYYIYNTGQQGTWSVGDIVSNVSSPYYRWAKIKLASTESIDGRLAFYRQGLNDGAIKLIPTLTASIVACEYSTDGGATWTESDTFPFEYIYGSRVDELGTFIYATREGLNSSKSVPIFETEEEATGWVNHTGDVDISDALNYQDIAERYGITNKTGTDVDETEFGTASNFRSHFTQQYILDRAEVSIVANALYDTGTGGFWEQIKAGVEMFGDNPISSVCGLIYYPIDLSTVFTRLTPQTYIYFGGYMFPPEGSSTSLSVYKLNGYDGYIDIGTFTIEPAFPNDDFRNWEPYCALTLYLPFIGMQKVSYNKYLGKTIKIRYYIDITNGSCLCILMANNKMMDYFNGSMGIQIPITLTDFSGYAQAQIRNLSNMAGVGSNIGEAALSGVSGDVGGALKSSAGAIGGFEKSMFAVSTTNINQFNTTKGSSGPMGNQYLPQKVYAIFEYIKTETTENLNQLEGTPTNASGNLGSFAGYLEADSIMLRTSAGMSEAEKAEFINLVQSGIYI